MEDLKGSRILITGGAGFVGSFVVEQLLDKNVKEIVVIDNFIRGCKENIAGPLATGRLKMISGTAIFLCANQRAWIIVFIWRLCASPIAHRRPAKHWKLCMRELLTFWKHVLRIRSKRWFSPLRHLFMDRQIFFRQKRAITRITTIHFMEQLKCRMS